LVVWALVFPTGWLSPYLFMFHLGYLLPEAAPRVTARWSGHRGFTLCVVVVALVVFLRARETRVMLWAEPLAAAIFLTCLVYGVQFKFYELLDQPWTRFYGRISYSFYLLHFPVLYLTSVCFMEMVPAGWLRAWPHAAGFVLAVASSLLATLPAWALFQWVEKSGIAFSKRLTGAQDRTRPAATQPVILTAGGS
jgi:peptidoglycan/LPS O-acetylase OafA/YrhL